MLAAAAGRIAIHHPRRVMAEEGIARGIYVTAAGRRVVVLHVFVKKSRKTPRRALATARERMKQVTS